MSLFPKRRSGIVVRLAAWILPAFSALTMTGCLYLGTERSLSVELPPLPPWWRQAFEHVEAELVVCWGGGESRMLLSSWPAEPLTIDAGAGPLVVLAYPIAGGALLRPAGLLAAGEIPSTATLTWQDGVAALLAYQMENAGLPLFGFNLQRLREEIGARAPADPWDLDHLRVKTAVASGAFRATDLRSAELHPVDMGSEGPWFTSSPFRAPTRSLYLTPGLHRVFCVDASPGALVSVEPDGSVTVFATTAQDIENS